MSKQAVANRRAQWLAAVLAVTATVFVIGGPLALAEHYAQNGAKGPYANTVLVQHGPRAGCRNG